MEINEKVLNDSYSFSEELLTEQGPTFLSKNVIDAQIPSNDPEQITISGNIFLFKESTNNETVRRNSQILDKPENLNTEHSNFSEDEKPVEKELPKDDSKKRIQSDQNRRNEDLSPDEREFLNSRVIDTFPLGGIPFFQIDFYNKIYNRIMGLGGISG